ncbi:MAG TPA: hypothetical protein VMB49_12635 [Acidobacteriaceae bacterium]|nr:hypothetical protein [Acidobacteriaceae bacterium]
MKTFGWTTRLKYGVFGALAGWLAGWAVSFPFELSLAWRYVDGNARQLPVSLAKGLVVWAAFSLFMAVAGFVPLVLPAVLLIPPRWIVRWRYLLIPAAPLAAFAAIDRRMGLLNLYYFLHPKPIETFFFTAPTFFVLTFALVVVWVYGALAARRLES